MLSCIPPRPEYELWLRVCSSVFAILPLDRACQILNAWSPEQRAGEYANKYRGRLMQVTGATLPHIAKAHGWKGNGAKAKAQPTKAVGLTSQEVAAIKRAPMPSWLRSRLPAEPTLPHPMPDTDRHEARRIAGELRRMQADGHIKGADDPEAVFAAHLLKAFKGTYQGKASNE